MIECYSLFKKDQTPDIYMCESQKHYAEKMKSNIKHTFYLIPFLQNSRKSSYGDRNQISAFMGHRLEEDIDCKGATGNIFA